MTDEPPKPRTPTTRLGTGPLPGSEGGQLQGIAPAVVEAFLNSGVRKKDAGKNLFTAPLPKIEDASPRKPATLGAFRAAADAPAIAERADKIRELAAMVRAGGDPAVVAPPPPEPVAPEPPPLPKRLQTGPLAPEAAAIKLQHLAMRGKTPPGDRAPASPTGPVPPAPGGNGRTSKTGRLEAMVASTLDDKGALRLKASLAALEDTNLPGKLSSLTDSINKLVPGSEGILKIGGGMGKKLVVDNLNPLLALSLAAKESAERINNLKKWNELTHKERVTEMVFLSGSLAEILGAVTPPPVNYGAQVMGVGLSLVGLAAENSDSLEEGAKAAAANNETLQKASETSQAIANQVRGAWNELGGRLENLRKTRAKVPAPLQMILDAPAFKRMKRSPAMRGFALGLENLIYNLTNRYTAFTESWAYRARQFNKGRKK